MLGSMLANFVYKICYMYRCAKGGALHVIMWDLLEQNKIFLCEPYNFEAYLRIGPLAPWNFGMCYFFNLIGSRNFD